jgi:hypothetical protein
MPTSRSARETVNVPIDEIDAGYQACARGHHGAGVSTDEQWRGIGNHVSEEARGFAADFTRKHR